MGFATFTITGTTPNAPGTAALGDVAVFPSQFDNVDALDVVAELAGATGGTLDVYLQTSPDGGTTWYDYAHYVQLAAAAAAVIVKFSVSKSAQVTTLASPGKNLVPALAANTVLGGPFGDRMRCVVTAGAGTSAGVAITIRIGVMSTAQKRN